MMRRVMQRWVWWMSLTIPFVGACAYEAPAGESDAGAVVADAAADDLGSSEQALAYQSSPVLSVSTAPPPYICRINCEGVYQECRELADRWAPDQSAGCDLDRRRCLAQCARP